MNDDLDAALNELLNDPKHSQDIVFIRQCMDLDLSGNYRKSVKELMSQVISELREYENKPLAEIAYQLGISLALAWIIHNVIFNKIAEMNNR